MVANGKFLGVGFLAAPNADVYDGYLDIVVMKTAGTIKMIDELVNPKIGKLYQ
jgi:diacylglycerol kinase family enzyme